MIKKSELKKEIEYAYTNLMLLYKTKGSMLLDIVVGNINELNQEFIDKEDEGSMKNNLQGVFDKHKDRKLLVLYLTSIKGHKLSTMIFNDPNDVSFDSYTSKQLESMSEKDIKNIIKRGFYAGVENQLDTHISDLIENTFKIVLLAIKHMTSPDSHLEEWMEDLIEYKFDRPALIKLIKDGLEPDEDFNDNHIKILNEFNIKTSNMNDDEVWKIIEEIVDLSEMIHKQIMDNMEFKRFVGDLSSVMNKKFKKKMIKKINKGGFLN